MEFVQKMSTVMVVALFGAAVGVAHAGELSANYSAPSLGSDMWTGYMGRTGMFVPHYDDCDTSSEAFVEVSPDGKGFCIEVNERADALWEDARNSCLQQGKRLPESAEWRYACRHAAQLGLTNMTQNGLEWGSNFAIPMNGPNNSAGSAVSTVGNGSCNLASWGVVAWNSTYSPQVENFCCVR